MKRRLVGQFQRDSASYIFHPTRKVGFNVHFFALNNCLRRSAEFRSGSLRCSCGMGRHRLHSNQRRASRDSKLPVPATGSQRAGDGAQQRGAAAPQFPGSNKEHTTLICAQPSASMASVRPVCTLTQPNLSAFKQSKVPHKGCKKRAVITGGIDGITFVVALLTAKLHRFPVTQNADLEMSVHRHHRQEGARQ